MFKLKWNYFFSFCAGLIFLTSQISSASIEDAIDLGWVCHTINEENPNVNVRVWYDPTPGVDTYKIHVEQACDRSIYPIATVQNAKVKLRSSEFIYSGKSAYSGQSDRGSRVELHIQTVQNETLELKSSLKIETLLNRGQDLPWAGAVIPLKCSHSRLSSGD